MSKGQFAVFRAHCLSRGLPEPVAEHRFHKVRKWRFDYAWPDLKVALEVDGGVWMKGGGGHSRPANIVRDQEKHNYATCMGWRVIRCQPRQLLGSDVISFLRQAMSLQTVPRETPIT